MISDEAFADAVIAHIRRAADLMGPEASPDLRTVLGVHLRSGSLLTLFVPEPRMRVMEDRLRTFVATCADWKTKPNIAVIGVSPSHVRSYSFQVTEHHQAGGGVTLTDRRVVSQGRVPDPDEPGVTPASVVARPELLDPAHLLGIIARTYFTLPDDLAECAQDDALHHLSLTSGEAALVLAVLPDDLRAAITNRPLRTTPTLAEDGSIDHDPDLEAEDAERRAEDDRIRGAIEAARKGTPP